MRQDNELLKYIKRRERNIKKYLCEFTLFFALVFGALLILSTY